VRGREKRRRVRGRDHRGVVRSLLRVLLLREVLVDVEEAEHQRDAQHDLTMRGQG
jgi:hypothetical protein